MLEPSFGGCGFLRAASSRLKGLGENDPWSLIFGCDVDRKAFDLHLSSLVREGARPSHFLRTDYLTLNPNQNEWGNFDVVVGNPPYVSQHNMYKKQRATAESALTSEYRLSGLASLWAYFVCHALRFLKPGGRMAWVLPGSALFTNYAVDLMQQLEASFFDVGIFALEDNVFEDAQESSVILLAKGFKQYSGRSIRRYTIRDVSEMSNMVKQWDTSPAFVRPKNTCSHYSRICKSKYTQPLGSYARILIGIVTGANRFFVVTDAAAKSANLPPNDLKKVISKFAMARGLAVTTAETRSWLADQERCLLICPKIQRLNAATAKYFERFPASERTTNVTFGKRPDWRVPELGACPDAFIPYMFHREFRIVLNLAKLNCTNTIHRVYFDRRISSARKKLLAISSLSTFSQLSARFEGRTYGGGVLKLEPSGARKIQFIVPPNVPVGEIDMIFDLCNRLTAGGRYDEARKYVDDWLHRLLPAVLTSDARIELEELYSASYNRRWDSRVV